MNKFSERSKTNLAQCHNDLKVLFNEVIRHFDCSVICGFRGEKEQNEAFKDGKSKLKYPQSKHNQIPSLAVDVMPYPINWEDRERMYFFAGFVMATARQLKAMGWIENEIRWGGDWNNDTDVRKETFIDLPHFEIVI